MQELLTTISGCVECKDQLALGPRPIVAAHEQSKIVIIGQAPGSIVHKTGVPWDDKSGQNLRSWLGVNNDTFYNPQKIALLPMGFCYPGKGKTGDLPPTKQCAPLWHDQILKKITQKQLIILIGAYAQKYYLGDRMQRTLTDTVQNYKAYLPNYFVLPHPSPRNNIWQAKNKWFKEEVLPDLERLVKAVLMDD